MSLKLTSAALAAAVLAGCAVGPTYKKPETKVPDVYAAAPTTKPAENVAWWTLFNDPTLDKLIVESREANWDLKAAEARVREARAARRFISSQYYPTVDGGANYQRARQSQSLGFNPPGVPPETDLWTGGFDATWEIDVFGRTRRAVEAADADVQASIANRESILLSLLGEVARNYVELRGAQRQLAIAEENIKAQQQTLELTRARLRAGLANDLDVARQEAQVNATSSQIPLLQTRAQQAMHRLSVLLGKPPAALNSELGPPMPIPAAPPAVPVGLPSDLLRRRPDIRQAERTIAAATARVGVAVADLYPRFTLTGQLGLQSNKFTNWGDSSSIFWNITPGVTVPIFNAGRLRANVDVEKARTDQAIAGYEQTVLNSLAEVEDALVAYQKEFVRRDLLAAAVSANQRSVSLSQQLYQQGLRDFINVLDAQRALYESQDALVLSETAVSSNCVALFKALGGGWEIGQEPVASAK